MSIEEQNQLKANYYNEAIRYMDNAKEVLKKANKKDEFFQDPKYEKWRVAQLIMLYYWHSMVIF